MVPVLDSGMPARIFSVEILQVSAIAKGVADHSLARLRRVPLLKAGRNREQWKDSEKNSVRQRGIVVRNLSLLHIYSQKIQRVEFYEAIIMGRRLIITYLVWPRLINK